MATQQDRERNQPGFIAVFETDVCSRRSDIRGLVGSIAASNKARPHQGAGRLRRDCIADPHQAVAGPDQHVARAAQQAATQLNAARADVANCMKCEMSEAR